MRARDNSLLFTELLENFSECNLSLKSDSQAKLRFAKLRWYNDLSQIETKNKTTLFSSENVEMENSSDNHAIINVLIGIYKHIIYFCKHSFNYILKYGNKSEEGSQVNDQYFFDEYIKRYKSFTDAAIHINEQLENLNVLVNYLYESNFQNFSCFPKFTVYRLCMTVWFQEVLTPLANGQSDLCGKLLKLFKAYLTKAITNIGEDESSPIRRTSMNNSNNFFNSECYSDSNSASKTPDFSLLSSNNIYNNSAGIDSDELFEDFNSGDYNNKYFIENMISSILDMDSNEVSVFFLNSCAMKTGEIYTNLEKGICNLFSEILSSNQSPEFKLRVLNYIKEDDFLNSKLINRTKQRIYQVVSENITEFAYSMLYKGFTSTTNELQNINNLLQESNLIVQDIIGKLQDILMVRACNCQCFSDEEQALSVLKSYLHTPPAKQLVQLLSTTIEYWSEETNRFKTIDKKIYKENCKRIFLDIYADNEYLSYTNSIDVQNLPQYEKLSNCFCKLNDSDVICCKRVFPNRSYSTTSTLDSMDVEV